MLKKVLLIVGFILVILASFNEATALQLLPFVALGVLAYFEMYQKKNVNLYIVLLSVGMVIINLLIPSYIDVVFWAVAGVAFWQTK